MKIQPCKLVFFLLCATVCVSCGGGGGGSSFDVEGCLLGAGPDCPDAPPSAPVQPDRTRPEIKYNTPSDGATWIRPTANIGVTFNSSVEGQSINAATFIVEDPLGRRVNGTYSYSDLSVCTTAGCGYNAWFYPSTPLAYGTTYTVTITTGVRNESGLVSLAADHQWTFKTMLLGSGDWQPTATLDAASVRYHHTAIWTGSEMLVWGGMADNAPDIDKTTGTGGRYDPCRRPLEHDFDGRLPGTTQPSHGGMDRQRNDRLGWA